MHRATSAALAAAAALAGCGGSGGYAPTNLTTAATPAATTPGPAPTSAGGPVRVTIKRLAFGPRTITTTVGRPVEWINRDDVAHTVTTFDGVTISSPRLAPGAHFAYVPARPGRLRYLCTIHPSTMSGELIVRAR